MEIPGPDPAHLFIRFIGWGVAIFLLLRLLRFLLPLSLYRDKPRKILTRLFPIVELVVWVIFLSWFIFLFSEADEIYVYVVLAILLMILFWISRYWVKDLIAGVIFRSSARLKAGDILHFEDLKGTIKKFGNFSVELETQDNQVIFIPYGKLADAVNIKSEPTGQSQGYTFVLVCKLAQDPTVLIQQIKTTILSSPWVSVNRMPLITLLQQSESMSEFEITVFPIDKSFAGKIENLVSEKYAGTENEREDSERNE